MIFTDNAGHMVSDTSLDELHAFAASIGLRRDWFQDKRIPRYDLTTQHKRTKAIRFGAALVGSKDIVRKAFTHEPTIRNHKQALRATCRIPPIP